MVLGDSRGAGRGTLLLAGVLVGMLRCWQGCWGVGGGTEVLVGVLGCWVIAGVLVGAAGVLAGVLGHWRAC